MPPKRQKPRQRPGCRASFPRISLRVPVPPTSKTRSRTWLRAASARAADDFGMLRESLAGLGLGSEPAVGRVEPSFAEVYRLGEPVEEPVEQQDGHRVDDLAAAAS